MVGLRSLPSISRLLHPVQGSNQISIIPLRDAVVVSWLPRLTAEGRKGEGHVSGLSFHLQCLLQGAHYCSCFELCREATGRSGHESVYTCKGCRMMK